eukprot:SAG22_NODE_2380_length_2632_cov_2.092381_1_plen_478_part_00
MTAADTTAAADEHLLQQPLPLPPDAPSPCTMKKVAPFLRQLFAMVEEETTGDRNVVWIASATGKAELGMHATHAAADAFTVLNKAQFEASVLPKYYKHNNFTSFVRQLNQYGFRKVSPDTLSWAEQHGNFRRGCPERMQTIVRGAPKRPARAKSQTAGADRSGGGARMEEPLLEVGNFGSGFGANTNTGTPSLDSSGADSDPALVARIDRLARDQSLLIHELIRMRKQQRRVVEVVSELTAAVTDIQDRAMNSDQKAEMCMQYFGDLINAWNGGRGAHGGQPRHDGQRPDETTPRIRLLLEDGKPAGGMAQPDAGNPPAAKRQRQMSEVNRAPPSSMGFTHEVTAAVARPAAPRPAESGALATARAAVSDLLLEQAVERWPDELITDELVPGGGANSKEQENKEEQHGFTLGSFPEVMLLPAPSFGEEDLVVGQARAAEIDVYGCPPEALGRVPAGAVGADTYGAPDTGLPALGSFG